MCSILFSERFISSLLHTTGTVQFVGRAQPPFCNCGGRRRRIVSDMPFLRLQKFSDILCLCACCRMHYPLLSADPLWQMLAQTRATIAGRRCPSPRRQGSQRIAKRARCHPYLQQEHDGPSRIHLRAAFVRRVVAGGWHRSGGLEWVAQGEASQIRLLVPGRH